MAKETKFDKMMDKKKGMKEGGKKDAAMDAKGGFKPGKKGVNPFAKKKG